MKTNLKIGIVVSLFPPKWLAGTEIATYHMASYLAKRGHDIHVITTMDIGMPKKSWENGYQVHRIHWPRTRIIGTMFFWTRVMRLLKEINVDVLHVQGIPMGLNGFLAKRLFNTPYVVWGQGSDVYLPWFLKRPISKMVLRSADAVIVLTDDMRTELSKTINRDFHVIPNGIDLGKFDGLTRDGTRKSLNIPIDEKLVLFVGTLRPVKGVEYLINAFDIVRRMESPVALMIVGDGDQKTHLTTLVKELKLEEYVTFIGQIPNEHVPQYMAASDVLVLPSFSEGFPVVVLEAMACGLPIIASRVGGLPEVVRSGENGFLVAPRHSADIANAIITILDNEELKLEMAKNNRYKASQYSWESVVTCLERVYQEILK